MVVILPVLAEKDLIEDTLQYLNHLRKSKGDIELCVVGSIRERNADGQNPTLNTAREAIGAIQKVAILEDQEHSGNMATQVNFAAQWYSRNRRGDPGTSIWFLVTNIDSRIGENGLAELIYHINRGVPIVQQSALFLSNYKSLGGVARAFALWQSRWTISHELRRLLVHTRIKASLVHVVGHGLCISEEKFYSYGMLPTNTLTEDLHFGYLLATGNEDIIPLRNLELADSPRGITDCLKQRYVWFFGPLMYPAYFLNLIRNHPALWRARPIRSLWLCVQGAYSALVWLLTGPLLVIAFIKSPESTTATVFLLLYFLEHLQCTAWFVARSLVPASAMLTQIVMFPIVASLYSLPAFKSLGDTVLLRSITKYKTVHD